MELLNKSNPCGRNLLTIVSRGSSIIAEIQRLSAYIPEDFTFQKNQPSQYSRILYDYDYFGRETEIENEIEQNGELNGLNEECRETHIDTVTRFCRLFESIVRYALDFIHYLEQLSQDYFLQMTVESLLKDTDGKQLLGEALYLYGVMLLQLDHHIPGIIRERLLVAFNRWRGPSMLLNYSKVCEVCRSTGYVRGQPIPDLYPLEFVNRIEMPSSFVKLLIGRFRNDDVYVQMPHYPDAEQRAVALSTQSSMLFIFLFFDPKTLMNEEFIMRDIVDKNFYDNWNVPYFMGYTFELPVIWKPFTAAFQAIINVMKTNAQRYFERNAKQLEVVHKEIRQIISDGFTKLDNLLEDIDSIVDVVRRANVILRFLVLHSKAPSKKEQFPFDRERLLSFLLDLAQMEFDFKNAVDTALNDKSELWLEERTKAVDTLRELGLSFSGTLSISRLQKDEQLQQWFDNVANEVEQLENENTSTNIQKIFQLTSALEKILSVTQISQSVFIKESVAGATTSLKMLGRLLKVDDSYGPLINTLSDFNYGFYILDELTPLMQRRIKADPFSVLQLRATFLKLTSILDLRLVRIIQAESNDAASVSQHYSTIIVDFVRTVIEIVPISIFQVLAQIIQLRTSVLKELPNRIERAKLKQYAQLDERYQLAKLTKEISVLTSGVLAMKTTLMGVITVDPKQMLEEGIRKQLVRKIVEVLYGCFVTAKGELTPQRFVQIVENVGHLLDGIRSSFEYMGDYVNLDGLRIWHHEYNRIMCYLVEQEANKYLKKKILGWQSEFQSKVAPIVIPKSVSKSNITCLGVFTSFLVDLTTRQMGVYCGITGGWLNHMTGDEVLGTKTINKMCKSIGTEGTSSIDELLSFKLAQRLKDFFTKASKSSLSNFNGLLFKLLKLWPNPPEDGEIYTEFFAKIKSDVHDWTVRVCQIGQIQLLKATIAAHLQLKCELEAQQLHFMLCNANDTVLTAIKQFYRDPTHNPYPSSELIGALAAYLENSGICDPLEKIFTYATPIPELSLLLFALTIINLNNAKLHEDTHFHMLIRNEHYGHYEFIAGVITILRQMNAQHQYAFLTFLGQYANFLLANPPSKEKKEVAGGIDVLRPLKYLMIFIKDYEVLSKVPRRMMDSFIPPAIFDFFSI